MAPLWWGTAAASVEAEGVAPASTWARWEERDRAPRSGEANAFATNYGRDLPMLAEHGITRHRLTLEWARIEPRAGHVDDGAVEHYRDVIRTARDNGIDIWAELHHFSLPGWFADDERGFLDAQSRTRFWPRHVDRMGELFDDLVAGWIPVHAPLTYARGGWLTGELPPGRHDPEQFPAALLAIHLAAIDAWRLLRSGSNPVATSLDLSLSYPATRSREPDERDAAVQQADQRDDLVFGAWLGGLRDGLLTVPGRAPIDMPDLPGAFEVIGFSYENARSVYADGSTGPYPADERVDPLGHAPWPEGLGVVLRRLHDALPDRHLLPQISVATAADDPQQDEWRVDVIRRSALEIDRAVADGVPVIGCSYATAVDGYEWGAGFDVQRGLFDRDRHPKPSALEVAMLAGAAPGHDVDRDGGIGPAAKGPSGR